MTKPSIGVRSSAGVFVTCGGYHPFVPEDEDRAIGEVLTRLRSRFPEVSEDTLVDTLGAAHKRFEGNPIRDFVPVLVERAAVTELRKSQT